MIYLVAEAGHEMVPLGLAWTLLDSSGFPKSRKKTISDPESEASPSPLQIPVQHLHCKSPSCNPFPLRTSSQQLEFMSKHASATRTATLQKAGPPGPPPRRASGNCHCQAAIHQDTTAPHIAAAVVLLLQHLRRHVEHSAKRVIQTLALATVPWRDSAKLEVHGTKASKNRSCA